MGRQADRAGMFYRFRATDQPSRRTTDGTVPSNSKSRTMAAFLALYAETADDGCWHTIRT